MSFLIDDLLRDTHDTNKIAADRPAVVTTGFPRYCFTPVSSSSCCDTDAKDTTDTPDGPTRTSVNRRKTSRKKRPSFAPYQVARLKTVFTHRNYPTKLERSQLALELNMTDEQVKTWFQNKRTKLKKKMTQSDEHYAKLLYLNHLISGTSPQHHHDYQASMSPDGYHGYPATRYPRLDGSSVSRENSERPAVSCRSPFSSNYYYH